MAGVYVHIPFCKTACSYCDFHFSTRLSEMSRMEGAIAEEWRMRMKEVANESIRTLYFGGGTPSLMRPEFLAEMIVKVFGQIPDSQHAEITLEVNPDDVTTEMAYEWKIAGVNRVSIGVQSFDDSILQWMKRPHNANRAMQAIQYLKQSGFNNITMDLIYGIPGMSMDLWQEQIEILLSLQLSHLSAYCLTAEQRTLYGTQVDKGLAPAVNQDNASDQYLMMVNQLAAAGFRQYEVSNFSLPGLESKHNSAYWSGIPYVGIGPSAHSFNGMLRRWNVSNNHSYMRAIETHLPFSESEELTPQNRINEHLLIGLRTAKGLDLQLLKSEYGWAPDDAASARMKRLCAEGKAFWEDDFFRLSPEGLLMADATARDMFV